MLPSITLLGFFYIYIIPFATLNRLFIPIVFVLFLLNSFGITQFHSTSLEKNFYLIFMLWILVALMSIIFSKYTNTHIALKEIMVLGLGLILSYESVFICKNKLSGYLIQGIRIAFLIIIAIALFEYITALHLPTSAYASNEFKILIQEGIVNPHCATSIFYNENDLSAFISIMLPFNYLIYFSSNKKAKALGFLIIVISILILRLDDAFICFIGVLAAVTVFCIFTAKTIKRWALSFLPVFVGTIIALLAPFGSNNFSLYGNVLSSGVTFRLRINTYLISLKEMFLETKGLGFGAGSFTNRFKDLAEQRIMMANPHGFWVEILSQYGLLVFLAFVGFLIYIYIKTIKAFYETKNNTIAAILASGAGFVISCMAPSSFIQYLYYWFPISMALYYCQNKKGLKGEIR